MITSGKSFENKVVYLTYIRETSFDIAVDNDKYGARLNLL